MRVYSYKLSYSSIKYKHALLKREIHRPDVENYISFICNNLIKVLRIRYASNGSVLRNSSNFSCSESSTSTFVINHCKYPSGYVPKRFNSSYFDMQIAKIKSEMPSKRNFDDRHCIFSLDSYFKAEHALGCLWTGS